MLGAKRRRTDKETEGSKQVAPANYQFNFTPAIQPHQKIFDLNTDASMPPAANLSANTLTHRFISRSKKFWMESKKPKTIVNSVSIIEDSKTSYEPLYLRHQYISYTVIVYIQMAFNIVISTTVLYLFAQIFLSVRRDFQLKADQHAEALHQAKLICTNKYIINQCGHSDRIPAIEDMCNEWSACMNQDVNVAPVKVSAEAIAEIINSFVEPISYKTLSFFCLLVVGTLVFSNVVFGLFKRNYNPRQLAGPNSCK